VAFSDITEIINMYSIFVHTYANDVQLSNSGSAAGCTTSKA